VCLFSGYGQKTPLLPDQFSVFSKAEISLGVAYSRGEDHKNYLHIQDSLNEDTDDSKAQSQKQN